MINRIHTCPIRGVAGFVALGAALAGQAASATGVGAGTLIQNTATATYTSGTSSNSVQSNTVTVKVDEILDVAVAGLTTTPIIAGSQNVVLAWAVTNTGNGPESFAITVNPAVAGNAFDSTVQSIAIDSNNNGTYEPADDQTLAAGGRTPAIAADGSLRVFAIVSLPADAQDGETSQVRLTAEAATGTGSPGTTFSREGEGGGDAVVGASGASANALDSMIASLVVVTLRKAAAIADPFGTSQPVPGATVTYTLTADIVGSGTADSLHIADQIPEGTTYQPGTLKLEGATLSDAVDADAGAAGPGGIDVNLGAVPGGSTRSVSFDVRIN